MADIQAITEITFEDQTIQVSSLPDQAQRLVKLYEVAAFKSREAETNLVIANAATTQIYNDVVKSVGAYVAEQAAAATPADPDAPVDAEVVSETPAAS